MELSAAFAGHRDYVIGFETVDDTTIGILLAKLRLEFFVVEIGCEVGELAVELGGVRPYFVAGMKEIVDDSVGVDAVERAIVDTNIVEAKIERRTLETAPPLDIVEETVDVIVDGIIIDHLSDADIEELSRRVDASEIFGENLHEHSFAHADATLQEDVFVEFVTTVGEHLFASAATVEVEHQKADDHAVVVVDDKFPSLRGEDIVGHEDEKICVSIVDFGIVHVGKSARLAFDLGAQAQSSLVEGGPGLLS